ncbi:MAG: hypothetical protein A2731_03070 [Candidatus Buchananbacteria bacterium RIFCSPHIGHO2_01_FULL_39_8]|uniref:Glycosyltransferase RgtA/B/C/D-like domain-containing protein n=1 Tax=Candidatus Buchananbacteria bacterium RIFCSPHIGHO2_01_FULL_39_8 TaxID=1797533 RepID=A0A1G1XWT5_9BACT|nr:MAG: hypothetical protein A2731_03070 [Candidatus Buchananbacteria bacterium RIFCSPHIGHO2_01_FULL_39_8]
MIRFWASECERTVRVLFRQAEEVINSSHFLIAFNVFIYVFLTVLLIHDSIFLPFSNPWGVSGRLTKIQYNPVNDILRFLLLVGLPPIIFFIILKIKPVRKLYTQPVRSKLDLDNVKSAKKFSRFILYFLIIASVVLIAGDFYPYHHEGGGFDSFHEGETLGPAIDYMAGKAPYREIIFAHGVFEDPLSSVLAFKLFGQSIAAHRTIDSILLILNFLLMIITLFFLFKKEIHQFALAFVLLLLFWLIRPFGLGFLFSDGRDIPLWCFLLVAFLIHKNLPDNLSVRKLKTHLLFFSFTFIPSATFAYSIDRGFYLLATSLIYVALIYLFFLKRPIFWLPILGGYFSGFVVLGLAIRWAYYDFFQYVFLILPRYKELMDGLIYNFGAFKYFMPVFLIALICYWLAVKLADVVIFDQGVFWQKVKFFYRHYFVEILLFLLAVFYFRTALGRSEIGHVYTVAAPIFILVTYVFIKHYLLPFLAKARQPIRSLFIPTVIILLLVLFVYVPGINFSQWYKFPLGIPDEKFIPQRYVETISFLKNNLGPDEEFLTMTSEASWYYFINRPSPTRFSVVWFAMPSFYQNEMVDDLKQHNVKFILYRNKYWANDIDGIFNERRLPVVFDYIRQHYIPFKNINSNEIWIKNFD